MHVGSIGHAFGEDLHRQAVQHRDDALEVDRAVAVAGHALHGGGIELHVVEPGFEQPLDASEPLAGVLQPHLRAARAQLACELLDLLEVIDRRGLGHLEPQLRRGAR